MISDGDNGHQIIVFDSSSDMASSVFPVWQYEQLHVLQDPWLFSDLLPVHKDGNFITFFYQSVDISFRSMKRNATHGRLSSNPQSFPVSVISSSLDAVSASSKNIFIKIAQTVKKDTVAVFFFGLYVSFIIGDNVLHQLETCLCGFQMPHILFWITFAPFFSSSVFLLFQINFPKLSFYQ